MKICENADARILVVDDNADNVRLVERFLEYAGYMNVQVITQSGSALEIIRRTSPDLVLLDLHMPKPDGYEILETLRESTSPGRYVPILVFTADGTSEARKRALEAGASDFLTKPGDAAEILLRVRNFLHARRMHVELQRRSEDLEVKVQARTAELSLARREAIEALARAAEFRDDDTGQHTKRVGELSAEIAREIGAPEEWVDAIRLAAPLHDVGKIALPDSILLKPSKLDIDEIAEMRRHTTVGGRVFGEAESPLMKLAREIALNHHERWDGSGYPNGLAGTEIPLCARVVAVADVYDALVHERPYKAAWSQASALAEIGAQAGKQFDPRIVSSFFQIMKPQQLQQAA